MVGPSPIKVSAGPFTLAGLHFAPASNATDRKGAAVVICHPMTGVKEQNPSLYAAHLAKEGFHAIAYDAAYQGESTGEPRGLEDPTQRAEDIKAVVTYFTTLKEVDAEKIGVLGICASGGYSSYATQGDSRIKALVTVSAVCVGRMMRNGSVHPSQKENPEAINALHQAAAQWRNAEIKHENKSTQPTFPVKPEEQTPESDPFYRDASEYYGTPRGQHPRSDQKMPAISYDQMLAYDSFNFQHLIGPRPLLMVAGDKAQSMHYSEEAIQAAKEPKELLIIPGSNHFDLYDDLSITGPKAVEFFSKHLSNL